MAIVVWIDRLSSPVAIGASALLGWLSRPNDMRPARAHAAAKRQFVVKRRPADWIPPSILKPPEVLTETEVVRAEAELKALQCHAFEIVKPEVE
jgi:hypothetical protein